MTIPEEEREAIAHRLNRVAYHLEDGLSPNGLLGPYTEEQADAVRGLVDDLDYVLNWLEAQPEVPESEPMQMPDEVRGWIESAAKVASDSARYYDADSSSSDAVLAWLEAQAAAPEPDWDEAPEWAMWWVVEPSGDAYWWQAEPWIVDNDHWDHPEFRTVRADVAGEVDLPLGIDWRTTLRERPQA